MVPITTLRGPDHHLRGYLSPPSGVPLTTLLGAVDHLLGSQYPALWVPLTTPRGTWYPPLGLPLQFARGSFYPLVSRKRASSPIFTVSVGWAESGFPASPGLPRPSCESGPSGNRGLGSFSEQALDSGDLCPLFGFWPLVAGTMPPDEEGSSHYRERPPSRRPPPAGIHAAPRTRPRRTSPAERSRNKSQQSKACGSQWPGHPQPRRWAPRT